MTYQPKAYREQGGDNFVIKGSDGALFKGTASAGATPAQAAAIADEAGTADATYDANEVTMLNDIKTKLNSVLAALRGVGIIAP